jgi:DNA-binding NtrC family response regulator
MAPIEKLPTILVVDDDPLVRALTIAILTNAGFPILEANDGCHALEVVSDKKIDILLSDICMPGMDGIALSKALKARQPDLRVILMSGLSGGDTVLLSFGWKFVSKPFLAEQLINTVNDVFRSSPSHRF